MIQRIQSVYLLITALLMAAMLFLPLANYNTPETEFVFWATGITDTVNNTQLTGTWLLLALIPLIILLCILAIFLFRNRRLQIKLGGLIILLLCGVVAAFFYYSEDAREMISGEVITSYKIPSFFPLAGIILVVLANRAIRADERLVRSADRLR